MRRDFLVMALALAISHARAGGGDCSGASSEPAANISFKKANPMKIRLKIKNTVLAATLTNSKTTQDFVSLLPITLTMNDLFGREKFGHLPRVLSEGGARMHRYEVGEVVYWSPGPDVAIFYRNDRQSIPDPGIIVLGKIDSGVEALDSDGTLKVTIEISGSVRPWRLGTGAWSRSARSLLQVKRHKSPIISIGRWITA